MTTYRENLCSRVCFVDQSLNLPNRRFVNWPDGFSTALTFDCSSKPQGFVGDIENASTDRAVALRFDIVKLIGHGAYYHSGAFDDSVDPYRDSRGEKLTTNKSAYPPSSSFLVMGCRCPLKFVRRTRINRLVIRSAGEFVRHAPLRTGG
ncbi:hypothetical protein [Sphingopyxis sp. H053]|uniref:hypothetical protein n=1 Tax=Sphingopyxis sp. H053 TaxID=1759067 RepID=UPI000B280C8B|nr:hypothetical protein [Sphingopyxis sp. H053]